jgi:hypothetical protein
MNDKMNCDFAFRSRLRFFEIDLNFELAGV